MVENHKSPAERPSLAMLSKTTIPGKLESKQSSTTARSQKFAMGGGYLGGLGSEPPAAGGSKILHFLQK